MPKAFHQLTNRGQGRRLRRLALKALEHYDLNILRVRLVTNFFNCIFRVDTFEGGRCILRVALPGDDRKKEKLRSEMIWLDALCRDTDLSVPAPLATRDGEMVVEVESEGVPEPRLCVVFDWVPGANLADHLTEANIKKLGRLSADLHAHAGTFDPPTGFHIPHYDRVAPPPPFSKPLILFEEKHKRFFPPEREAVFRRAIDWAQRTLDDIKASGEQICVLHGDLHQWNVRVSRGVLSPIDFEDLMWGWPVQDIATTLFYHVSQEDFGEFRANFKRGYTSLRPWPEQRPGEIDAFIAARGIGMINLTLQHPNPDWRVQAPVYIETVENRLRFLLRNKDDGEAKTPVGGM